MVEEEDPDKKAAKLAEIMDNLQKTTQQPLFRDGPALEDRKGEVFPLAEHWGGRTKAAKLAEIMDNLQKTLED